MVRQKPIPKKIRSKIKIKCKARCCICGRYGVDIHHLDQINSHHDEDNLIPLCKNCHDDVSSNVSRLSGGLSIQELKIIRDEFYKRCEDVFPFNAQTVSESKELKLKFNKLVEDKNGRNR